MLPDPPADVATIELETVPFFPQADYQCGPAALATVLVHSGVDTDANALVPQVYVPAREGSLQAEMLAATRRAGRIPWLLENGVEALFAELSAGHPVLVLQNLGVAALPLWHYAVVIGFDPDRRRVILRSGTERRREESWGRFLASWQRAGRWGLVALPPEQLPASHRRPGDFARALASQEQALPEAVVLAAWETARRRWPTAKEPLLGSANALYAMGEIAPAVARYGALLEREPGHAVARNNLADLLLQARCPRAARAVLAPALATRQSPALAGVLHQTAAEIDEFTAADAAHCHSLTQGLPRP